MKADPNNHRLPLRASAYMVVAAVAAGLPRTAWALADTTGTGIGNQIRQVAEALSGTIGTSVFLVVLVVCGGLWWIQRTEKSGERLGKALVGAILVFGSAKIHAWITGVTGSTSGLAF